MAQALPTNDSAHAVKQSHSNTKLLLLPTRPFPSCLESHYESEARCKAFIMKISFHSYANKSSIGNGGIGTKCAKTTTRKKCVCTPTRKKCAKSQGQISQGQIFQECVECVECQEFQECVECVECENQKRNTKFSKICGR